MPVFISFHTAASETINSLTPQSLKCHQVQQISPPTQTSKHMNAGTDLSTEQCVPLCQHCNFRGRRDITQRSHFKSPTPANSISKRRMLHYSCYLVFPFEHPGRFWRSPELQCRSSSFKPMKIQSVWTMSQKKEGNIYSAISIVEVFKDLLLCYPGLLYIYIFLRKCWVPLWINQQCLWTSEMEKLCMLIYIHSGAVSPDNNQEGRRPELSAQISLEVRW